MPPDINITRGSALFFFNSSAQVCAGHLRHVQVGQKQMNSLGGFFRQFQGSRSVLSRQHPKVDPFENRDYDPENGFIVINNQNGFEALSMRRCIFCTVGISITLVAEARKRLQLQALASDRAIET